MASVARPDKQVVLLNGLLGSTNIEELGETADLFVVELTEALLHELSQEVVDVACVGVFQVRLLLVKRERSRDCDVDLV